MHFLAELSLNTTPLAVKKKRNFTCLKCFLVKVRTKPLQSISVNSVVLKLLIKKEMTLFFMEKMVAHRKLIHLSIFVIICLCVKKKVIFQKGRWQQYWITTSGRSNGAGYSCWSWFWTWFNEGMPIIPDDSVSVLVGKILLKLSAHFNISETAINFLTENLLDTLMHCDPCSKKKSLEKFSYI